MSGVTCQEPCFLALSLEQIKQRILSNLSTPDLLNCRLVSPSWNEQCLAIFQKRSAKPHVKLDKTNIKAFMDFVTSHPKLPKSFPWKFVVNICAKLMDPESRDEFNIFAAQVLFVLNLYGPDCVDELILAETFTSAEMPELPEFFAKLTAGLERVHIVGEYFDGIPTGRTMRFPKLKSFKLCGSGRSGYVDVEGSLNAVEYFCHENMENLEEFKVPVDHEEDWYQKLCLDKLSSLEIVNIKHASTLLDKIRLSPSPPIIQKLSFGSRTDAVSVQVLTDILGAVASSLRSLKLIHNGNYEDEANDSSMIPLPPLPQLLKFRIDLRYGVDDRSISVDPIKYNFNAETLPALEKVDFPTAYIFNGCSTKFPNVWSATLRISQDPDRTLPSMDQIEWRLHALFPNLRTLIVANDRLEKSEVIKDLILALMMSSQGLSLEELVIRNGDDELNSVNFLGEILNKQTHPVRLILENMEERVDAEGFEKLFQKFLRSCSGLGETGVEMTKVEGLEPNKVNVVATVQPNPRVFNGIKNVKRIRLEQYSSIENEQRRHEIGTEDSEYEPPRPLNASEQRQQLMSGMLKNRSQIDAIVKHFPALEQLEMSHLFFGQTKKSSCAPEIEKLATKYPNLNIRLI